VKGSTDPQTVQAGLELIRRRHYYLKYCITGNNNEDRFIYCDSKIPLKTIGFAEDSTWKSVLEHEANTAFNVTEAPLVRAALIQYSEKFHLVVTISHIISDGMSALIFMIDLLSAIDCLESDAKIPECKLLPPICPDLSLFPELPAGHTAPALVNTRNTGVSQAIAAYVPIEERKSGFITIHFDQDQTAAMRVRSRGLKVSMNTYLASAMLMVFRDYAISKALVMPILTKCSSGINLRKYYRTMVPNDQLGMWSGFGYVFSELSDNSSLRNIALRYEKELKDYIERGLPFTHLRESARRFIDIPLKQRSMAVESQIPYLLLTNLGRAPIQQRMRMHELIGIDFVTPMHRNWINDLGFGLCTVTCFDALRANFVYPIPAMRKETAVQLAESLKIILAGSEE
jgi:hypothetical protein